MPDGEADKTTTCRYAYRPDGTLEGFYDHGDAGETMPADGGDADKVLARFAKEGVDTAALAARLQSDAAKSFVAAWGDLMSRIEAQSASLS